MSFLNRYSSFVFYLIVMLFIALIDVKVGIHINLWIIYGIPIGLAAWNLGKKSGLLLAAIALLMLLVLAIIWGSQHITVFYFTISFVFKAFAYFVLVMLVSTLRSNEVERIIIPPNLR